MLKTIALLTFLALAAAFTAACSSDSQETTTGGQAAQSPTPTVQGGSTPAQGGSTKTVSLKIENFAFQPASITAQAGDRLQIAIKNDDGVQHTFTIDSAGVDVSISPDQTANATVNAASQGSLAFHCKIHPSMVGTIQVGSGGPAATVPAGGPGGY